ncbi:MAG: DUF5946 family protein [Chloroflexi bacterium]|nr:DUF5946 family protein [Chloroflexota bacterium]
MPLNKSESWSSQNCPGCGASLRDSESCQTIFESFLALEYADPGYGEVHFLTVACFMIQHGCYSDEALAWIEQKLRLNLEQGVPAMQICRQAAKETGQGVRLWKITRPPDAPQLPKVAWSMTIIDVKAGYHDAASYCALVTEWARRTLKEMSPLLVQK